MRYANIVANIKSYIANLERDALDGDRSTVLYILVCDFTPSNLDRHSKTAIATGGRVNLGFHTALRLLCCGTRVIVSTRYPRDALERYRNEHDAAQWISRLRIMGADFKTANVFALVKAVLSLRFGLGTLTELSENY
jgi:hypothetical protein